jgi:hypothetical protein
VSVSAKNSNETIFQAGEPVTIKGMYRVLHYAHRLPHESAILALRKFPYCNQCGDRVRFQLVRQIGELLRDYNFTADEGTQDSQEVLTE